MKTLKILFVENHSIFAQQAIINFLSTHQVTVVPSLSMARASFAANQFDLLLVDYDLDDGKAKNLSENYAEPETKFVLLEFQPVKKEMLPCFKLELTPFATK